MRHNGCGGRAAKVELLTGIAALHLEVALL